MEEDRGEEIKEKLENKNEKSEEIENEENMEVVKEEAQTEETAKQEDFEENEKGEEKKDCKRINFQLVNLKYISNNKNNKTIIIAIASIIVIAISVISAIVIMQNSNKKEVEIPVPEPETIAEEPPPSPKIPVYSEEASIRMQNIYAPDDGEKVVYLTFDDGPSNNITPQILEILRREEVKATFFVLGSRVEIYPELVKQEYDEGHYIGNHGYSHTYKSIYSSVEAILNEYNNTETIIKNAIGNQEYNSHLFRFPGGSEGGKYAKLKNEAKAVLKANGIEFINWNCLTNDSVGKPTYESLVTDFLKTSERQK